MKKNVRETGDQFAKSRGRTGTNCFQKHVVKIAILDFKCE